MNDIITLSCPSCGGQLQVDSTLTTLTCKHCGNEHLVHREGGSVTLESFARCPRCGRNDRVEKVSAILKSHKQEVTSTEQKTEVYIDKDGSQRIRTREVPKTYTQVTGLARVLKPPERPKPLPRPIFAPRPNITKPKRIKNVLKIIMIVISSIVILTFCFLSVISFGATIGEADPELLICAIPSLFMLVIGIVLLIVSIKMKPLSKDDLIEWEKEREQIQEKWNDDNAQKLKHWQETNAQKKQKWDSAMENWNNLYYCHRDDCVFVPGKATSAPIERLNHYLNN